MADRSSARLFGSVFRALAKWPDERNLELAEELWGMIREHDFSEHQMEEDDALVTLGLARRIDDPDFPGDRVTIYGPEVKAKRGRR